MVKRVVQNRGDFSRRILLFYIFQADLKKSSSPGVTMKSLFEISERGRTPCTVSNGFWRTPFPEQALSSRQTSALTSSSPFVNFTPVLKSVKQAKLPHLWLAGARGVVRTGRINPGDYQPSSLFLRCSTPFSYSVFQRRWNHLERVQKINLFPLQLFLNSRKSSLPAKLIHYNQRWEMKNGFL